MPSQSSAIALAPETPSTVFGKEGLQLLMCFTSFQKSLLVLFKSFLAIESALNDCSFLLMKRIAYLYFEFVLFLYSRMGPCLGLPAIAQDLVASRASA